MTLDTLRQLQAGQLQGSQRLSLKCNLQTFPEAIFDLADTLEVLDLSGNQLTELPHDFARLHRLKIAFFSFNQFTEFPSVLAQCPHLSMIGFKSNKIKHIDENAFPPTLRWLILTDNQIQALPESIGNCRAMQKLMLAGNQLTTLPASLQHCQNLELLRISANQLPALPTWLLTMPKLAWLAYAGNTFNDSSQHNPASLTQISYQHLTIGKLLGEGASGMIHQATLHTNNERNEQLAIKLFKGGVTSDGYPRDEMRACILAGRHENLVTAHSILAQHPDNKSGLLLPLLSEDCTLLGNPPDFDSCTRDCYPTDQRLHTEQMTRIALSMASAMQHLHGKGIMHGDLYAHNIHVHRNGQAILGDLGAATYYGSDHHLNNRQHVLHESLDVLAFGHLLEELLLLCTESDNNTVKMLHVLQQQCQSPIPAKRPSFAVLRQQLETLI